MKLVWDFHHDPEYIPTSVKCAKRTITPDEAGTLSIGYGLSGEEWVNEWEVQVLRMRIQQVWNLMYCNPGCCPPRLVVYLGGDDYFFLAGRRYLHGLEVFADENEELKPFAENLEVVRSCKSHTPLRLVQSGRPIVMRARKTDVAIDFHPIELFYAEFMELKNLPDALLNGFTPLGGRQSRT